MDKHDKKKGAKALSGLRKPSATKKPSTTKRPSATQKPKVPGRIGGIHSDTGWVNHESPWVRYNDPFWQKGGASSIKHPDSILHREKITAEQVKALVKLGVTVKDGGDIVFEKSRLAEVKKILGEK